MTQSMKPADPKATNEYVTLTDHSNGKTYDFPLMPGSVGPKVIDVRSLYGKSGHFTFDPGYTSTGACESKITYIDGEAGVLMHRGYKIEDLAEHSDFMCGRHLDAGRALDAGGWLSPLYAERRVSLQAVLSDHCTADLLHARQGTVLADFPSA
jgi:hypothetical protein